MKSLFSYLGVEPSFGAITSFAYNFWGLTGCGEFDEPKWTLRVGILEEILFFSLIQREHWFLLA